MGVAALWKLVSPAEQTKSLSQLALQGVRMRGTADSPIVDELPIIGIDMGTYFDECVAVTQASGMHVASGSGPFRPLFFRLCKLLKVSATFVFVFDGPNRPPLKRGVLVNTTPLWWVNDAKTLVASFGFFVHQAPGEAEAELATLNRWGSIDALYTKDGDALVFGATTVLRSLTHDERKNTDNVKQLSTADIAQSLGFTHGRLFVYALAAGGDYDPGIAHCGRAGAAEIALSGVGDSLYRDMKTARNDEEREVLLEGWRGRVSEAIANKTVLFSTKVQNNLLRGLANFPPLEAVNKYVNPATSATFPDYQPDARKWRVGPEEPNPVSIIRFCRDQLGWSDATALLKVLRAHLWEGLVLRMIFSEQCRWTATSSQFGTPARQLPIEWCGLKVRKLKTSSGQIEGRLHVRELDVVAAMVGEGIFPEVLNGAKTVEVWVPSMMLPAWAAKIGKKPKRGEKGKGKAEAGIMQSMGEDGLGSFDPTGDVFRDLEQLEAPAAKRAGDIDRGEGPSKKRRVLKDEVIDLTDDA